MEKILEYPVYYGLPGLALLVTAIFGVHPALTWGVATILIVGYFLWGNRPKKKPPYRPEEIPPWKQKFVCLLGAPDPEMAEMKRILEWCGVEYLEATRDGRRVHPGNAYTADQPVLPEGTQVLVLIECEPTSLPEGVRIVRIDHHRKGDFGYLMPPSQFWPASSLGQLCAFLGVSMYVGSHSNVVLAAMDHCSAAAFRGECPGVTPKEVFDRKVAEIVSWTKQAETVVRERIAFYAEIIRNAYEIFIGKFPVKDLREHYLGEGYSLDLLTAQVAAFAALVSVLLRHRDRAGESEKYSLSGHASPELIKTFMEEWAPAQGLKRPYGAPDRGYAGAYLAEM